MPFIAILFGYVVCYYALYLGMCVEQKLGDAQAEQSYALQLRNRYPESAEAKAIGPCP